MPFYTDHRWEDWYITFRVSKNLAQGNGLVFTIGERLHSFTSPFNTLIPALISYITGNISDELVIWVYRIICCPLLAGSLVFLKKFSEDTITHTPTMFAMLCPFAVDVRIIDFTINGQETSFMIFFVYLTIYFMVRPSRFTPLALGLCHVYPP